jgi:hypothetical protein
MRYNDGSTGSRGPDFGLWSIDLPGPHPQDPGPEAYTYRSAGDRPAAGQAGGSESFTL